MRTANARCTEILAADAQDRCWDNLPEGVRQHLIDRMRDRAISIADLNQFRVWTESKPEGEWYEDFGSFKIWAPTRSCSVARRPKENYFGVMTPEL